MLSIIFSLSIFLFLFVGSVVGEDGAFSRALSMKNKAVMTFLRYLKLKKDANVGDATLWLIDTLMDIENDPIFHKHNLPFYGSFARNRALQKIAAHVEELAAQWEKGEGPELKTGVVRLWPEMDVENTHANFDRERKLLAFVAVSLIVIQVVCAILI